MKVIFNFARKFRLVSRNTLMQSVCISLSRLLRPKFTKMYSSLVNKEKLVIGTHDGMFHCDEVLGCFLLKVLFPKASIERTRNEKVLDSCDLVLDVGGVYNPQNYRFDHHQNTFDHTMSSLSDEIQGAVRLSSAGLIYHHFGKDILKKILKSENNDLLKYVYRQIYNSFVVEIDGIDNGIPAHSSEPLYTIHTNLSTRVRHLNKPWYFEGDWDEDEHFHKAMDVVGKEFTEAVIHSRDNSYRARHIVEKALLNRFDVHESGEIIELATPCPWKEHFFYLEQELKIKPEVKYVIFKSDVNYRVMGVSVNKDSFLGRKFLPESWRGLRNEALTQLTGIDGCIFVHSTGFIGGNTTREGAIKMAIKSLQS